MNIFNFFDPTAQLKAKEYLISTITAGFKYPQAAKELREVFDIYIAEDQYLAYEALLDINVDLDIGCRRSEVKQYAR